MQNKYYKEGKKAYRQGKHWKDNPYSRTETLVSNEWQAWFNGWGDESDKIFLKLVKSGQISLTD
jgi:hypothetical protein